MESKPWYEKFSLNFEFPFLHNNREFSSFSLHWHEPVEIVYVFSGSISISVEGEAFTAKDGDIIVINSERIHGFYDATPHTRLDIFQFGLEIFDALLVDLIDRESQMMALDKLILMNEVTDKDLYGFLLAVLQRIKTEFGEKKDGYRLAIKMLIYQMAMTFVREIPSPPVPPRKVIKRNHDRKVLEKALSYIHDNYADPDISLDGVANATSLSKFYFTRFFKSQTGQTFHNYLNRLRVSKAEECLMETDKTITDISLLCGFSSLNTFNRVFKLHSGTTPSNFRMVKIANT